MKLSIVTTMYYSAPYLDEFYARVVKTAKQITSDYEIIFVDDGSPDDSLNIILKLQDLDSQIKIIELSRNFGHHNAIMTGLEHAKGQYIFLIDCDLEEAPELLSEFWKKMQNESCDVVYGVQESRNDSFVSKFFGNLYYKITNYFSNVKIPKNLVTTRLMERYGVVEFSK